MKEPEHLKVTVQELKGLQERLKRRCLTDKDYDLLGVILHTVVYLREKIQEKGFAIKRLLRVIFGARTESSKNILNGGGGNRKKSSEEDGDKRGEGKGGDTNKKKKPKGHGRNGAAAYTGANTISVSHDSMESGDRCPCCDGKLFCMSEPGRIMSIVGQAPIQATVYELEKLRCGRCGKIFTAEQPPEAGDEKYDPTAGSMIALLKYGSGMPFHRIEKLQESFGIPLPTSTQWDIVNRDGKRALPAYIEMIRQAAQGKVIHNDDTFMKILDLIKESRKEQERHPDEGVRTGTFTTGMISVCDGHRIALFFSGSRHAGENMTELLSRRAMELPAPIQMCDALSRNTSKEFRVILANCLAHGRRKFVILLPTFPHECRHIIEELGKIYKNDKITKQEKMSPRQRLIFHKENSASIMMELKEYLKRQFDERKVEPNSSLGKAISYMLNHWKPLTLFLRKEGAPLDNNICERALKMAILHRKNALFYKSEQGACIGDIFMSLIHTCSLSGIDPFKYLTALQKYFEKVAKQPENWMPWNYEKSLPPMVPP